MENSHIQWTDHTYNPWRGCTKVSPGCLHCYAEARDIRFEGGTHWGKGAPRVRAVASTLNEPIKWNRAAQEIRFQAEDGGFALPDRPRVFCASLADWLDDEVPVEWLAHLLMMIQGTPDLDWLLLTKRPENWRPRLEAVLAEATSPLSGILTARWLSGMFPDNVWALATIEDQARVSARKEALMKIPARVHGFSVEPMLGPIDLYFSESHPDWNPNWVICGGESGPGCRPFNPGWARALKHECSRVGVSFFMKQLGGERDKRGEMADLPEDLRCREFPIPN